MSVIAVVGLGYVGLPLAVEFGKKFKTIGFDLSEAKIEAYRNHVDPTGEVATEELRASTLLEPTCDAGRLREADFVVQVEGDLAHPQIEQDRFSTWRWIGRADLDVLRENRAPGDDFIIQLVTRGLAWLNQ